MKTMRNFSLLLLACRATRALTRSIELAQGVLDTSRFTIVPGYPKSDNKHTDEAGLLDESSFANTDYLNHAVQALDVMQADFFELWIGTWPTAIDWTAAVINTHVSALLGSLARFNHNTHDFGSSEVIHRYFSHNIAYYFGEDAFAIRNEAYDDMLWVVLGWLESSSDLLGYCVKWLGHFYVCGGMTWNPRLEPYKNAITNQLYISASAHMYLYFPGDSNSFPFFATETHPTNSSPGRAHDPKYLRAAVEGYRWLKNSSMKNSQGLYVDGFHIRNWGQNGSIGTGKCDERNEMVYTYNQGVILSGLRALWESTGDRMYLYDGYELVRNVMKATGWTTDGSDNSHSWAGLGRNGIMEELCDSQGSCGQDAQTFKGIYFQHLANFCMALPLEAAVPGKTHSASKTLAALHKSNCLVTGAWVVYNAKAALRSRNKKGRFGMWWGKPSISTVNAAPLPHGAVDYKNRAASSSLRPWNIRGQAGPRYPQDSFKSDARQYQGNTSNPSDIVGIHADVNDRGRGRTVETQGGGLAVLRAAWEMMSDSIPRSTRRF